MKRAGQIIAKGPRKWLVRVYIGRDANGRRQYTSKLVHGGRKAADAALSELLTEKSAGTLRARSAGTVGAWLDEWLKTIVGPSTRPQTAGAYAEVVNRYVRPHLGARQLARLSEADVRSMIVALRERNLSPRIVRMAHEVLRNALEQAVDAKHIAHNPARGRTISKALPPKAQKERPTIPSDRVADFLDVVSGDPTGAYWITLLFSGLRPSEALGLQWKDIHRNVIRVQRVLVWRQGTEPRFDDVKTDKSRRAVPVPTMVVKALAEHKRQQAKARLAAGAEWTDRDLVFCDERGGPLRQWNLRRRFGQILTAAELPVMRVYDLRHTAATLLLERGIDLKVVAERLGHSTTALTSDTYSHVTPRMQQQAVDVLEEFGR